MVNRVKSSRQISNEDLESVITSLRASTTESKAVWVECPLLKPDCLLSRRFVICEKGRDLVEHSLFKCFSNERRRESGL